MAFLSWRFPALVLLIAAIVVVPFLYAQRSVNASAAAGDLVKHTLRVEAAAQRMVAASRDFESAALTALMGATTPVIEKRLATGRPRAEAALDELEGLTRDNPKQQVRIGELRTMLRQRFDAVERLRAAPPGARSTLLAQLVARFPVLDMAQGIIEEEERNLVAREAREQVIVARADRIAWLAMLAQLLLLGLLAAALAKMTRQRGDAEQGVRRADQRARQILDTVREPIAVIDRSLRVVQHNAAFAELYGFDAGAGGARLADAGDGAWSNEETLRRIGDVALRGRELWDYEQRQRTADGVERTMLINAARMSIDDADTADAEGLVLLTASDVSAQKASEREIRELNRQLEGKVEQVSDVNRELEAFSYSVSHDLRAPLRHIAGFADKLRRHLGERMDDKSEHYLSVIGTSAKRMSQLIDDLLVYSRLGRSGLRLQPVDFQTVVADKRALLDANAEQEYPGHRIEWRIAPLPVVVGDENMLRQVWLNLLGNAVKYSSKSEPAQIEVRYLREADGTHRFEVADNGVGFDMNYAGKLFGVFQRLHGASEFEGTGIGLASVRRVLARHGGRIWAESEPGRGARFFFTLPPSTDAPLSPEFSA
ncbi:ATP-binding protein [Cognatilysobacter tabacisoli]|uniref:ATP-binding protein n=1 Tax=Cognatilysobacter tabacisoli TaxID=2315424 RepID=UPI000E6AF5C3|nr:ATP-binding protein [Lysobacter tabacisoli]